MPASGDRFVEVADLGKRYGDQWAVRDVDFTVDRGEIFGVVGPNGAGKTTILKVLAGLLEPSEGRARVGDWSTDGDVDGSTHRARIGYLPESAALYEEMTATGYLEFFADLYDVPGDVAGTRIAEALDRLDLDAATGKRIGDFSKGMKRKVAIVRSLVNDPELLIYDEPASGLDPVVSATILDLLEGFQEEGRTIVISAHNLHHIERLCDRVAILLDGEIGELGTVADIRGVEETRYRVVATVDLDGAEPVDAGYALVVDSLEEVQTVRDDVEAAGGRIVDVQTDARSLEEAFLDRTERDADAG